ncbi:alpha/beta fold hydrolase [Lentzea albida]|uniref:Pimeloyl-ACP methyl ester carboxylesterase n=1 Tax=Lentzea albida TaxID=65499 RepID=A0A1H9V8H2_9PSEU|nr:alpha/beta fold hydrolase [Lentzea albida]SES17841.1 Pimeloyl-ACP methyl ester carboxylesterase [Lentzea albida]
MVLRRIHTNGVELNVAVEGEGPVLVLLHGFPHTWQVWEPVVPALAAHRRVIAPDLRGLGASARPESGYAAADVANDVAGLLDALGIAEADVAAIDLGVPPAFLLAAGHPGRVRRLVLMEALVGTLPGAEDFLRHGPPWWFGFHSAPGLAESVLLGHEAEYLDFFLHAGTAGDGVTPRFRDAVHEAYKGRAALKAAFEHYRALPESARQIEEAVHRRRLSVPTLTIGAAPVGDATYRQVKLVGDEVRNVRLEGCGHIIPQHRPEELLAVLQEFL